MFRKVSVVFAVALAAVLGGCGLGVRADAAKAVAGFLDAVHHGDRTRFEAGLDREALREDLRRQIVAVGLGSSLVVDGGPSEFALDRRITPSAFHLVEAQTGQALPLAPTPAQVAALLKVQDRSHVCLQSPKTARCVLSFAKRNGVWRLVAMPAANLVVAVPPAKS